MSDATVQFSVLCSMLDAVARSKKGVIKRKHIRTFLDHVYTDHQFFSALRLILPELDKERGNYGLKEAVLAKFLTDALGLAKDSADAQKLLNWRKGGQRAGANAGNFPMVAAEVLYRRQKAISGGLKIKDVNDLLDRLAAGQNREEKTAVLSELISKTNHQEMRWIIMIILKDLKLGVSEKTVFSELHPDATDVFNVTCDLKLVCEKLRDRNKRHKRQDIEVGKAVRPQLAARVANVEGAWKKLRGKQVLVECKFDGDRIQVHKNGTELHFWSRSFIDHDEFKEAIADVLCQNILPDKCILDGEMLVWDRLSNRFADFGRNREIAKAAKDGLDTGQQLCYVAFDILYNGDTSVIHQPLRERQQLLKKAVRPVKGRLEVLLPEDGLNSHRAPGEPRWSILANSADEVEHFFRETVENRDEGVVLKDLDSKWEPSDRSGKWLKLKPDYLHSDSDLDALIIGGYFGSGRHGGEVAQFLLGLAEKPIAGGHPTKFYSFCKVGTGLTDDESEHLVHKLKPYFRRNEKGSKPPSFYVVTNVAKERPDVWIDQPEKSVILQITSDIRTIESETFAAPYSLRFPRVQKVRYDKPWYDCLDVQTLVDIVHSKSATSGDRKEEGGTLPKARARKSRPTKSEAQLQSFVPSHMMVTDVSHVKQTTRIFKALNFYFVNNASDYPTEKLHEMVVENGGTFSMNLNPAVTQSIAAEKKGIKYQAAARHGDVIHYSWIIECTAQKALLPVGPKYYLNMSDSTKEKMKADMDELGDSYFMDLDVKDLKQICVNMDVQNQATDIQELEHYMKKYCPIPSWCHFSDCRVYFHQPLHSINSDSQAVAALTLRRLALEVAMHEGLVSKTFDSDVTHMVVYTVPETPLPYQTILQSLDPQERKLLRLGSVKVVSQHWIEDALSNNGCLPEAQYNLRDASVDQAERQEEESTELAPTSRPSKDVKVGAPNPDEEKRRRRMGRGGSMKRAVQDSSSESDDIAPKRRLKLEAGSKHSGRVQSGCRLENEPTLRSRLNKVAGKRKKFESDQSTESVAFAENNEGHSGERHVSRTVSQGQGKSRQLGNAAQSSLDAMLMDLLPSYFAPQEGHLVHITESEKESVRPSHRLTLQTIEEDGEAVKCSSREDGESTPGLNVIRPVNTRPETTGGGGDLSSTDGVTSRTTNRMQCREEGCSTPDTSGSLEDKRKVSYKQRVNQFLNFD